MARKHVSYIQYSDDFDRESPADEVVELSLDGVTYELDLTAEHAQELRSALMPYLEAAHDTWRSPPPPKLKRERGRRYGPPRVIEQGQIPEIRALPPSPLRAITSGASSKRSVPSGKAKERDIEARKRIREWAHENGFPSSALGKIHMDVLRAFVEANPDAYVPESTLAQAGLALAQ